MNAARDPSRAHPILVLWATPRSTSTAFEWMMRMRGDHTCFHEPLGEAWHQGDDARWPRLGPDSPRQPGLTMDSALRTLEEAARSGPVFSKDFAYYIAHLWTPEYLARFRHSFLIRHPAKVLPSYRSKMGRFDEVEAGFAELRELFDRVADHTGEIPPVVDSDDLLENPVAIVDAYCRAVGIEFIEEALSWEPGERREVLWYDTEGVWHANLKSSTGLHPQPRTWGDISDEPDWIKEIHERALPHYQHMHSHRLGAAG